jgi:hypothetical protein
MENEYNFFVCSAGSFPFKYLGIPIHYRKLCNKELKPIQDCFERKLSCWLEKILSYGDCIFLINSMLTSLTIFLLFFLEIPKGVQKRLIIIVQSSFGKAVRIRRKTA